MVINSAQMQNAGKDFLMFQGLSSKQDDLVSKDSFSAIFNNVTGSNSLFQTRQPEIKTADVASNNKINNKTLSDNKYAKNESIGLESRINKETTLVEKTDDATDTNEILGTEGTDDEVTEDFIEKAASLFVQITVTIQVVLNVSMDELNQGMQDLGLLPTDMLDANNRYSLFVNLKATGDATNLLKDNSLVELLNTMEDQLAQLFEQDNVFAGSFEDSLKACLDSVIEKTTELMQTFVTQAPLKDTGLQVNTKAEGNEAEAVVIDGIVNENAPKVEVSAQSQNDSTDKNNTESSKKEKTEPVKAEDLSNRFVNHLVNSFENRFQQVKMTEIQNIPDLREIVNQIMEQVKVHVNNANTSIEIQLTPEALGKVHVSVEDNNGVVTAKFQAENRVAKEAIESSLVQFKEHLAEQGIKVDSVEVSVGNFDLNGHQFGKGQGQEAESHVKKHFSLDDAVSATDSTEDLTEAAYIDNGISTVSFKA